MTALKGSLGGGDQDQFASANAGGVDAEQKISPRRILQSSINLPFSGSFDRNRLGISYPITRAPEERGDFQEE